MRLLRANLHKSLCSLLVAIAFVTLPLPALADNTPDTEPAAAAVTATTPPADTTTTVSLPPLALADTALPVTTPLLQSVPQTTPAIVDNANSPSQPVTDNTTAAADAPMVTTGHVENNITSDATSGSASVTDNRKAGDATTGAATSTATVINVANGNGASAGPFSSFECNVTDDTQGSLLIDPSSLLPICQSTNAGTTQPGVSTGGLQNGTSLTDILNNIALTATSGNASVSGNRTAGDATTGDATALANILNVANTNINANKSFLGVINIYGNLNGNILVPQSLVDSLIANNGSVAANDSTTTDITNNLNASATSGSANVEGNRRAGDATSGDAATSLTVLNLTGQEVIAKNCLLVFVNILGQWRGVIVPAPGSKTALLGSGVQTSTTSGNQAGSSDTSTSITNNITVNAQSGDADVSGNRRAGDATSGKASAGANLLNITNSNFQLGDWFGALFINVLGSWIGNFDIQAAIAAADPGAGGQPPQIVQDVQVYQVTDPITVAPTSASEPREISIINTAAYSQPEGGTSSNTSAVLGASTTKHSPTNSTAIHSPTFDLLSLAAVVIALTLLVAAGSLAVRHWYSA